MCIRDRRCVTTKRWPDGVEATPFFQKNCPDHRPSWLGVARGPGSDGVDYCLVDSAPGLVWLANLAALEVHLPMALAASIENPRMIVFDLDPGEGVDISGCCEVALLLRETLAHLGLVSFPKTSGGKGLQVYVPINLDGLTQELAGIFAKGVGDILAKGNPDKVLTNMTKSLRKGKVFIDWSQNSLHKTTIGVYSMRGRERPCISTPLDWSEVDKADKSELAFLPADVIKRVHRSGDLFAQTLTLEQQLPGSAMG